MTRTSLEEASAAPPAVPASADPSVRPSTACGSAAAASRHKQRPIAVLPRASEQRDEARERRSAGRPCACPSGSAVMSGRSRARRGENVGPRHAITAEGKWTPRNCTRAAQGPRWWEDIRRRGGYRPVGPEQVSGTGCPCIRRAVLLHDNLILAIHFQCRNTGIFSV
jgi:hypothetical protein